MSKTLLGVLAVLAPALPNAVAATIPVSSEGELLSAIAAANPGDEILLTDSILLTGPLTWSPADNVTLNGAGWTITTVGDPDGIVVDGCDDVTWRDLRVERAAGAVNHIVTVPGFVDFGSVPFARVHTVENLRFENVTITDNGSGHSALLLAAAGNVVLVECALNGRRGVQLSDLDFGEIHLESCDIASSTRDAILAETPSFGTGNGWVSVNGSAVSSTAGNGFLFNWWGRIGAEPPDDLDLSITCGTFDVAQKPVVFFTSGGTPATSETLGEAELNGNTFLNGRDDVPLVLIDYVDGDLDDATVVVCDNNVNLDPGNPVLFGTRGVGNPNAIVPAACGDACGAELLAEADTYVRRIARNTNEGGSTFLRVRQRGRNRALVRFNQAELLNAAGAGPVGAASLELLIDGTSNNWGPGGRYIRLYRLTSDWAEGNGFVSGNSPSDRGSGEGATWNCAVDSNIANRRPDCSLDWEMAGGPLPWDPVPTDSLLVTGGMTGVVTFDVTSDVNDFVAGTEPNHGWILVKDPENAAGAITFVSREGGSGPVLILDP